MFGGSGSSRSRDGSGSSRSQGVVGISRSCFVVEVVVILVLRDGSGSSGTCFCRCSGSSIEVLAILAMVVVHLVVDLGIVVHVPSTRRVEVVLGKIPGHGSRGTCRRSSRYLHRNDNGDPKVKTNQNTSEGRRVVVLTLRVFATLVVVIHGGAWRWLPWGSKAARGFSSATTWWFWMKHRGQGKQRGGTRS